MPVTLWEDVAGLTCVECNKNPATHFYGNSGAICCQCHDPIGGGLVTPEEARKAHEEIIRQTKGQAPE